MNEIVFWIITGIIIAVLIDYIMFRIWHYYAHKELTGYSYTRKKKRDGKRTKQKKLEKELKRRGYGDLIKT